MADFPKKLKKKLVERETKNALRGLTISQGLVDFSSNDYLGLADNQTIFLKTSKVLSEKGIAQNGATGSRLLSGNSELYREVEEMLCDFHKTEASLVFNSGYDANMGLFASIPQRDDLVFYDELVHASIRDGIKMGNARSYKFDHNNLVDLSRHIERCRKIDSDSEVYIVTESVFSMDGDSPDLKAYVNFCQENNCRLMVDEAHAIGVFGSKGRGLLQELGLEQEVFARIITFGKAMGCHGAAVLGSEVLKIYLLNFARSFIYTTGLPPHTTASILASHQFSISSSGTEEFRKLRKNINYFNHKLETLNLKSHFIPSNSAIHCCIVMGNTAVREVAENLRKKGFDLRPILSPTVREGQERLRFCLHAFNTEEQILEVLEILKEQITKSPSFLGRE